MLIHLRVFFTQTQFFVREVMEEEGLDLNISDLLHEILLKIVSLIPLKEAIRTSILSTAWRSLWAPIEVVLDFDSNQITTNDEADKGKLNQLIMAVLLKSCDGPELWKFCLSFPKRGKRVPQIEESLSFLATKGVGKELHLDFSGGNHQRATNFDLILQPRLEKPNKFSSLKTLHLRSVDHLYKNLASTLFYNCQLLETLKLEKCIGLRSINVQASTCLTSFAMVDCPNVVNIKLSAPNLKSFHYRGVLPQTQIECSPNLVDVTLDLRQGLGENEFDREGILSLFSSLKDTEILTISGWLPEWLCAAGVIFKRLQFQFNKLKELCWFDSSMNRTKLDSLACFLNISPSLEILFVKIDQSLSSFACPYFHQYWHEPHLWMDYETVVSNASQLEQLKIVKLGGFTKEEDQLLLMDLLLKKSLILKSMSVISPENQSWCVSRIPRSQLRCHKKQMVISSPNEDYFFGLTEGNERDSCSATGHYCL